MATATTAIVFLVPIVFPDSLNHIFGSKRIFSSTQSGSNRTFGSKRIFSSTQSGSNRIFVFLDSVCVFMIFSPNRILNTIFGENRLKNTIVGTTRGTIEKKYAGGDHTRAQRIFWTPDGQEDRIFVLLSIRSGGKNVLSHFQPGHFASWVRQGRARIRAPAQRPRWAPIRGPHFLHHGPPLANPQPALA